MAIDGMKSKIARDYFLQGKEIDLKRKKERINFNIVCLIGILIGFLSLIHPWYIQYDYSERDIEINFFKLITQEDINIAWAALFIAGLFLSFITPLGSFVSLTGAIYICLSINGYLVGIGMYFAFLSIFIIMLSIIIPYGLESDFHRIRLFRRLITFNIK